MAEKIKGITIEFRGNATPLQKAIREVNKDISNTTKELSQINRALKFNPTSVELWRQKQDVLNQRIKATSKDLDALKQAQKQMDANGVNKNSEEYRKLQREIIETEGKLKTFKQQLKEIGNVNLKALSEGFKQVGDKAQAIGKELSMKVTAPLAAIGAVSAKSFAEVDKTMQLTNKTMGNSKEQADLLNQAMKDAAANSIYGMNDAATATLNFARAGLSAEEAAAALAPAMNLAAGEGGNLDTVSAGLVATINGFGDTFDNTAKYADVFANACNNSALDVDSLSESMSIAAPIFAAAGYSVNDAALYMGILANKGIDANKGATSLKTGLARLVSPAKEGAKMMDALGISVTNADGSMKDSVTIQKELHDAFSKLSESEQIAAASAIFGKNQMAPWLALINTAPADVNALNASLQETGTVNEMAAAMMSGFGGSLEKLKSSIDVAKVSLGEALAPAILAVANGIQKLVDWFNALSPTGRSVVAIIGMIAAAIGPMLVVLGILASSIGSIIGLVGTIGPMLGAVGGAIGALVSGPLLLIVGAIAAVIAIGVLLYKNWDKIKETASKVGDAIKKTWESAKDAVGKAVENLKNSVVKAWDKVTSTVEKAAQSIWDALTWPFDKAYETIKTAIGWIKDLFPIDLSNFFGDIKLPHFSWDWIDIGGIISIPSIDIDWYKKGGIFSSPTIAGIGEAGSEAVVPLDKFWDKMDAIAAASQGGGEAPVINIYPQAHQSATEIAREVEKVLVQWQRQRSTAYGNI